MYLNIWGNEDETDVIKDDLIISFESLKNFYVRMTEKEYAVFVSIYEYIFIPICQVDKKG